MRYQSLKAGCGPTALANGLELLGIKRNEIELSTVAGTTPKGTDASGIVGAAKAAGRFPSTINTKDSDFALYALHYYLCNGRPVIICVDKWDHWVVAAGILGERILVIDSANNELVLVYPPEKLTERWEKPGKGGGYYGIVL